MTGSSGSRGSYWSQALRSPLTSLCLRQLRSLDLREQHGAERARRLRLRGSCLRIAPAQELVDGVKCRVHVPDIRERRIAIQQHQASIWYLSDDAPGYIQIKELILAAMEHQ